ncbi:hypothetical protein B7P43_G02438 [Cryptotermes secundus]|uniref:Peptidase A2 domain-containing protein n=1 Tax=Cryptotermes secundus TaxID=105785 RepID=A0A2J7QFJ9_9NEOP|nr:hypothetical protein B7P43_G02438 [Cryptotermes secundus]
MDSGRIEDLLQQYVTHMEVKQHDAGITSRPVPTETPRIAVRLRLGPTLRIGSSGHYHLSTRTRHLHPTEDRACEAAIPSPEQRIRQLLTVEEIGDRKPSQFLRYLKSLVPEVSDNVIRSVWTCRLPRNVQSFFAGQNESNLEAAALCADRISEVEVRPALASVDGPTDIGALRQRIQSQGLPPRRQQPPARQQIPLPGRRHIQYLLVPPPFRRSGTKLYSALLLPPAGKLTQRTSSAAHVCGTTGRLFIADRVSKRQFLVDTGSDHCVYPRRLVHRRMERTTYDLCAANGTTIHTYGWLPLSLNLGLRRELTWRFVVADVAHPMIGVDFLSHFGLLVDCRNNRILDGVTTLRLTVLTVLTDFFLFPHLKSTMKGHHFGTVDKVKEACTKALKDITKEAYHDAFDAWKSRWKRCIDSEGEYFEAF